jgi:hypothetical protein
LQDKAEIQKTDIHELIVRLESCNRELEYAAYNYDGSKLEDLSPGIMESTSVAGSCLIEIRLNNELLEKLKEEKL